jgi:hypothetical protein
MNGRQRAPAEFGREDGDVAEQDSEFKSGDVARDKASGRKTTVEEVDLLWFRCR